MVVAKGRTTWRRRSRRSRAQSRVPVIENKPLARALYRAGRRWGGTIPESLFQAVAEVLAYVYRLKKATDCEGSGLEQDKVINRDLVLANSNILSAVAVLVILALMIIPVPPIAARPAADLQHRLLGRRAAGRAVPDGAAPVQQLPLAAADHDAVPAVAERRLDPPDPEHRARPGRSSRASATSSSAATTSSASSSSPSWSSSTSWSSPRAPARIAEVAARFTLDAMPGKQMAIDADLNAGLINETQARARAAPRSPARPSSTAPWTAPASSSTATPSPASSSPSSTSSAASSSACCSWACRPARRSSRFTMLTVGDGLVSADPGAAGLDRGRHGRHAQQRRPEPRPGPHPAALPPVQAAEHRRRRPGRPGSGARPAQRAVPALAAGTAVARPRARQARQGGAGRRMDDEQAREAAAEAAAAGGGARRARAARTCSCSTASSWRSATD